MSSLQIALVRHGRASAGWDTAVDPGLDDLGRKQADEAAKKLDLIFVGQQVQIVSSPLLRCQQTAEPFAELRTTPVRVCAEVAEIPSPNGVEISGRVDWLRVAMQGTWSDLGGEYVEFRDSVVKFVRSLETSTVVFSHFIAINAVIGSLTGDDRLVIRSLDNCSVTLLDRDSAGNLRIAQTGHEADTLIR
ncbi:MAG: phosphoglycerate mutase family protein [Ilumatobacteraceae bacterium]|nr:phosphoglycerate mutase family protein [Ilumatobacteraceae bacterium]